MTNFSPFNTDFAGNIWHIAKKSALNGGKLGQKEPENKMSTEPSTLSSSRRHKTGQII